MDNFSLERMTYSGKNESTSARSRISTASSRLSHQRYYCSSIECCVFVAALFTIISAFHVSALPLEDSSTADQKNKIVNVPPTAELPKLQDSSSYLRASKQRNRELDYIVLSGNKNIIPSREMKKITKSEKDKSLKSRKNDKKSNNSETNSSKSKTNSSKSKTNSSKSETNSSKSKMKSEKSSLYVEKERIKHKSSTATDEQNTEKNLSAESKPSKTDPQSNPNISEQESSDSFVVPEDETEFIYSEEGTTIIDLSTLIGTSKPPTNGEEVRELVAIKLSQIDLTFATVFSPTEKDIKQVRKVTRTHIESELETIFEDVGVDFSNVELKIYGWAEASDEVMIAFTITTDFYKPNSQNFGLPTSSQLDQWIDRIFAPDSSSLAIYQKMLRELQGSTFSSTTSITLNKQALNKQARQSFSPNSAMVSTVATVKGTQDTADEVTLESKVDESHKNTEIAVVVCCFLLTAFAALVGMAFVIRKVIPRKPMDEVTLVPTIDV